MLESDQPYLWRAYRGNIALGTIKTRTDDPQVARIVAMKKWGTPIRLQLVATPRQELVRCHDE